MVTWQFFHTILLLIVLFILFFLCKRVYCPMEVSWYTLNYVILLKFLRNKLEIKILHNFYFKNNLIFIMFKNFMNLHTLIIVLLSSLSNINVILNGQVYFRKWLAQYLSNPVGQYSFLRWKMSFLWGQRG